MEVTNMLNELEKINLEKNKNKEVSKNIDEIKIINNKQKIETNLNENIEQKQRSWTESELFKIIDNGLDAGIRTLLGLQALNKLKIRWFQETL